MFDVYGSARRMAVNGVELMVTDHGPAEGAAVLLLHGWPDTAYLWRHQIPVLTGEGYRVLCPDMRGFGGSDKPEEVEAYRVGEYVADVEDLLNQAGIDRAHVVAHDHGAVAAWALALRHPHRVESLTALSVGHPNAFGAAGLRQLQMSWYTLLFQFEGVAETFLSSNDWAMFRRLVGNHPETERWIESLSQPGALTASLKWYRANAHPRRLITPSAPLPTCPVPTLGIWSSGDTALSERQMTGSEAHVDGEWEYLRIDDVSHWIPLDAPDQLNEALVEWIGRH